MSDAMTDMMYDALAEDYYKIIKAACGHRMYDEALAVCRICRKDVPLRNCKFIPNMEKQIEKWKTNIGSSGRKGR